MQYAEIAVNSKTSLDRQTFTYSIRPEQLPYLQPGIAVEVPFHGRNLIGIVLALKNKVDSSIRLKSINKIIETYPIINSEYLSLARKISQYYLSPISEVIFMMIPPIAKRLTEKNIIPLDKSLYVSRKISKKYIVHERIENRIDYYLKLIDKAINSNKDCLILFSKDSDAKLLAKELKQSYSLIHGNLTNSQRYELRKDILLGKTKIVIGSRSAIFSPLKNLGLIIIDSPEDFSYKDEQAPRYNAIKVAEMLSEIKPINLVFGVDAINCEEYLKIKNRELLFIKKFENKIDKSILDVSNEKTIIAFQTEELIKKYLNQKKKILIFINRKGEGTYFKCLDCGKILLCPSCEIPLKYSNGKLVCYRCNSSKPIPSNCENCQSVKLKNFGIGTKIIQNEINKLFPTIKTKIIEKGESVPDSQITSHDLIIATTKIFDFHDFKPDLSILIDIDNIINLPEYNAIENANILIQKLIAKTKSEMVIQTFNPENILFKEINNNLLILEYLLNERKLCKFPPYGNLIKIVCENKEESRAIKELEKLFLILKENLKFVKDLEIINPHPCFIAKKRNKFRYQIIIKIPSSSQQIKEKISWIKELSHLTIDVDPITLL